MRMTVAGVESSRSRSIGLTRSIDGKAIEQHANQAGRSVVAGKPQRLQMVVIHPRVLRVAVESIERDDLLSKRRAARGVLVEDGHAIHRNSDRTKRSVRRRSDGRRLR